MTDEESELASNQVLDTASVGRTPVTEQEDDLASPKFCKVTKHTVEPLRFSKKEWIDNIVTFGTKGRFGVAEQFPVVINGTGNRGGDVDLVHVTPTTR